MVATMIANNSKFATHRHLALCIRPQQIRSDESGKTERFGSCEQNLPCVLL